MDQSQILPALGGPVSTDVLNLDVLDTASHGEVIYAATMLVKTAMARMADPSTYHDLATFAQADGADWAGLHAPDVAGCADQSATPTAPTPPDNYVDSLPAIGAMVRQLGRAQDVIVANYAHMLDSVMNSQDTYLGTPYAESAFRDAKHYLRDVLKLSSYAAEKHRVRAALFTNVPGGDPAEEMHQPKYAHLGAAFQAGLLPGENVDRIAFMDKDLTKYVAKTGASTELKDEILEAFEPGLVEAAANSSPEELSQAKHRWMDRIAHELDSDGPSPALTLTKQADNALRTRKNADGSGRIWMDATPAVFAKMTNFILHQSNFEGQIPDIDPAVAELLGAEANPDLGLTTPVEDPDEVVAENADGTPVTAGQMVMIEHLTQGQKIGAILIGMFNTLLSMDPTEIGIKKAHGASAQLVVVQDIETAHRTLGYPPLPPEAQRPPGPDGILPSMINRPTASAGPPDAPDEPYPGRVNPTPWTPYQSEVLNTGPIHPADADIAGCDAEIVAQLWNGPDTVLQQKRTKRHHTPAQRRAILARDRGCMAPGCTIPAAYCDIHHIVAWLLGGNTDEANAIALCAHHHAAVHNGKWTIRKQAGLTYFQPAPWLDPHQPLLRNMYWNL